MRIFFKELINSKEKNRKKKQINDIKLFLLAHFTRQIHKDP